MPCIRIAIAGLNAMLWFGALSVSDVEVKGQTGAAAQASFEVVSIRPSDPSRTELPNRIGPASFTATATLKQLIMSAYGVQYNQITGGPAWAEAKAGSSSSRRQIASMLQTLLADRFNLKLHRETRTLAGYVLGVEKSGPRLPAAQTATPSNGSGILINDGEIWVRGLSMRDLAAGLWVIIQAPVRDETNIDGSYDFKLRFEEGGRGLAEDPERLRPALDDFGLSLQARRIPVEVLLITHADRPVEN
jgi:uncharacterized protein (TIGR03435 family)